MSAELSPVCRRCAEPTLSILTARTCPAAPMPVSWLNAGVLAEGVGFAEPLELEQAAAPRLSPGPASARTAKVASLRGLRGRAAATKRMLAARGLRFAWSAMCTRRLPGLRTLTADSTVSGREGYDEPA